MENVLSFPRRIPITRDGQLASEEFIRFIEASIFRLGGTVGPSIRDLDAQQFADAGIEEGKAQLGAIINEFSIRPTQDFSALNRSVDDMQLIPPQVIEKLDNMATEINELRETVHALITEIQALKGSPL